MTSLTDLVKSLPHPTSPPAILANSHQVAYVTAQNQRFVIPNVVQVQPLHDGRTSVVLLSAPAAVGKSTVAKHIGVVTGAPVWDLSGVPVGTGSLTGTLVAAFGAASIGTATLQLKTGQLLVVLDALDETQLLSGPANFEEFLKNVSDYCVDPLPKPCLLLLARADTAEIVEVALLERSAPYAHYRIDFFGCEQAEEFVSKALAAKGRQGLPWEQARDALFDLVYDLLGSKSSPWDDPNVRGFLGYAPVLEAMADYLDHPNPSQLVAQVKQARAELEQGGEAAAWRFLLRLIRDLLRRERDEKVGPALKRRLAPVAAKLGWAGWDALYGPDEQCQRVLAKHFARKLPAPLPDGLPVSLRPDYENAIEESLPNHPFRGADAGFANVVFREYLSHFPHFSDAISRQGRGPFRGARAAPSDAPGA